MNRKQLDPDASPSAAFGARLRSSREERGWIQDELASRMGYSGTHISAVETARKSPTLPFARRADEVFESGGNFERMWRRSRRVILLEGFPEYLDSEAEAAAIRLFEINIIPSLFQTPEYARAYQDALVRRGRATQEQADERLALLLDRQQRLVRRPPLRVQAVIDESCLRRPIGQHAVMADQLKHLENLAQTPGITLQVAPFSLGEDRPFGHPVTLLTMPNRRMVGYSESQNRGYLEREHETLAEWIGDYDQLQVEALPRAATLSFIREAREGFEKHG